LQSIATEIISPASQLYSTQYTQKANLSAQLMVKRLNAIACHRKPISELRSVTCSMGLHSVTCHPTQVKVPHL